MSYQWTNVAGKRFFWDNVVSSVVILFILTKGKWPGLLCNKSTLSPAFLQELWWNKISTFLEVEEHKKNWIVNTMKFIFIINRYFTLIYNAILKEEELHVLLPMKTEKWLFLEKKQHMLLVLTLSEVFNHLEHKK